MGRGFFAGGFHPTSTSCLRSRYMILFPLEVLSMSLQEKYGGVNSHGELILNVCASHAHMIGHVDAPGCEVHGVYAHMDDGPLAEPVAPVAYLPHQSSEWVIGGRTELER